MKQFHDAKVSNTRLPSLVIPTNYGSLTHETRIKDAVNLEDLICLLATVRTLKLSMICGLSQNYLLKNNICILTLV